MYYAKRDLEAVIALYKAVKEENLPPTYTSMGEYLETAMRLNNPDQIVEALQDFKKQSFLI